MEEDSTRSHLSLSPDCILIEGASRGALYDLASGDVYSIDPVAVAVVKACENGLCIDDLSSVVPEAGHHLVPGFLEQMVEAGLGSFTSGPRARPPLEQAQPHETLEFIWLEVREDCNLRCRHCYCMSESRGTQGKRLEPEEWISVMEQAHALGCRDLQFIGGEPLLMRDAMFDLAFRAREIGFEKLAVFTSLSFLEERWIDHIVELGMNVACSIYSRRPEIHDLITTKKGSFERTITNVRRLKERGVQPRFALTAMKHNQDVVEETMELFKELGMEHPSFDIVRPSGRGNDAELLPDKLVAQRSMRTRAEFLQTDRATFMRRLAGNSCWQGKVAVGSTGDVHPCIMHHDDPAGNVRQESLEEVILSGVRKFWDLSLDGIEICSDCEYRYACHDCRPIAYGPTCNLTARSDHCGYDPYTGEWTSPDLVTLRGTRAEREAAAQQRAGH